MAKKKSKAAVITKPTIKEEENGGIAIKQEVTDTMESLSPLDESYMTEDELTAPEVGVDAFNVTIEEGKDYISGLPSEILSEIMSYLVLDHDPERGAKKHAKEVKYENARKKGEEVKYECYVENPHALLSLSAMSRFFRDNVEGVCRRLLLEHKEKYYFRTDDEIAEARGLRRSERLKAKPRSDQRCWRVILIRRLEYNCIRCNSFTTRRATMANGVACCQKCEHLEFPGQVTLTAALKDFDLRDWMLIATRKPGPRSKKIDLPVIPYGTIRTGKPYLNGMCVSYHFFTNDVLRIANAVHEDLDNHMIKKESERFNRKLERRDREHRKLKIRFHQHMSDKAIMKRERKYHQKRLAFYQDPNCTEGFYGGYDADSDDEYDSDNSLSPVASYRSYGPFVDVHERLCIVEDCDICHERKLSKYCPWWG